MFIYTFLGAFHISWHVMFINLDLYKRQEPTKQLCERNFEEKMKTRMLGSTNGGVLGAPEPVAREKLEVLLFILQLGQFLLYFYPPGGFGTDVHSETDSKRPLPPEKKQSYTIHLSAKKLHHAKMM